MKQQITRGTFSLPRFLRTYWSYRVQQALFNELSIKNSLLFLATLWDMTEPKLTTTSLDVRSLVKSLLVDLAS